MKRLLSLLTMALITLTISAVPAKKGLRTVKQSDGTTLQIQLLGDEWHHSYVTADGFTIARNEVGDYYYVTNNGLSTVKAHDANQRSAAEMSFIQSNNEQLSLASHFTSAKKQRRAKAWAARKESQVPQTGSPKIPVILVNYNDVTFGSEDPLSVWQKQISAPNEVSVYQYFVDQSFGKYTPEFDVYGPYTLSGNRSTYGANDTDGNDKGVGKMVAQACLGMDEEIDFSEYDNDGDGVADVVIVLYAGVGEASSYEENSVWPCQWDLGSSDYGQEIELDGTTISKFAVFNELLDDYSDAIDGIGTMCHEFSHCIDLPDFYDVNYGNHFGMGSWSLLDNGCYNDQGYTPCGYTAYERNFMGWFDYTEPQEGTTYTTKPVADGGEAYIITSDNPNEYYILENIQQSGWDEYAYSKGLMVTHVYYDEDAWYYNEVNTTNTRRMTIIPADNSLKMVRYNGYYYVDDEDQVGDLYPYDGNNVLTSTSTPASTLYSSSSNLEKPITEITQNSDGTVSFVYMAEVVPPAEVPVAVDATDVASTSFTANWNACTDAESYTLRVRKGSKPTYSLVMEETFAKCTKEGTSDIGGSLDDYLDNSGWTGSTIYQQAGGVRIGKSKGTGTLKSPALDMTESDGKMTIVLDVQAYNNDTDVNMTITTSGGTTTETITSSTPQTLTLVMDCTADASQYVTFATTTNKKRVVVTNVKIYSGDASEASNAPRKTVEETRVDDVITVTGITDTKYTVANLDPATDYYYDVKAVYAEEESDWSNKIYVTTTEGSGDDTGIYSITEPTEVGIQDIYDLQGRKVTTDKLAKGIYIVNGKKVAVK